MCGLTDAPEDVSTTWEPGEGEEGPNLLQCDYE